MTTIEQYIDHEDNVSGRSFVDWVRAAADAQEALRAVAKLHKLEFRQLFTGNPWVCAHCTDPENRRWHHTYPCPTIQTIHAALGIDGKEEV